MPVWVRAPRCVGGQGCWLAPCRGVRGAVEAAGSRAGGGRGRPVHTRVVALAPMRPEAALRNQVRHIPRPNRLHLPELWRLQLQHGHPARPSGYEANRSGHPSVLSALLPCLDRTPSQRVPSGFRVALQPASNGCTRYRVDLVLVRRLGILGCSSAAQGDAAAGWHRFAASPRPLYISARQTGEACSRQRNVTRVASCLPWA